MNSSIPFPPNFLWGAATSAYQIEGSPLADGAGPSIWHRFVHTPGMVHDGDTGDVACDHYRRFEADVALMKRARAQGLSLQRRLGARAARGARARSTQAGLDFYERLVDALLERGIEPMVTLYHWDLPAALDDRGGWLNPDIADWFADYADVMFRALDDRVKMWATLNEPWVVTDGGYLHGALAPGHRNRFEAPIASHNLLRAHGAAVQAYRAQGKHQIGLVVNIEPKYPASSSEADRAATERADAYMNRQYLDPALLGPLSRRDCTRSSARPGREWPAADMALIKQPIDFVGVNYYTRSVTRHDEAAWPVRAVAGPAEAGDLHRDRLGGVPAGPDRHAALGQAALRRHPAVHHRERRRVLRPAGGRRRRASTTRCAWTTAQAHRRAAADAMRAGVDVRGYFAWSLLDNLEWSHGYSKRFGLVHVDFDTQQRTPKASARYYANVIADHGRTSH